MSKLEFLEPTNDAYFDVLVEVAFANPLASRQTFDLMGKVLALCSDQFAQMFTPECSYLELTTQSLALQLRFYNDNLKSFSHAGDKEPSMLYAQFMFFIFAAIDREYPLAEVPFPPDFRSFLDLPNSIKTGC